jgi:hypothetical protein
LQPALGRPASRRRVLFHPSYGHLPARFSWSQQGGWFSGEVVSCMSLVQTTESSRTYRIHGAQSCAGLVFFRACKPSWSLPLPYFNALLIARFLCITHSLTLVNRPMQSRVVSVGRTHDRITLNMKGKEQDTGHTQAIYIGNSLLPRVVDSNAPPAGCSGYVVALTRSAIQNVDPYSD